MGRNSYNNNRSSVTMDSEIGYVRSVFAKFKDKRAKNACHSLVDILMSGFAMFSLKHASLLEFDEQTVFEKANLKNIYGIETVCSDTTMSRVLDTQDPNLIRALFPSQFKKLQKTGILKDYGFKIGDKAYHIIAADGVQHFSSKNISCPCCLKKEHTNGSCTYHHNMLCAVLVHPERREVFTLNCEPIIQQDGVLKNDCERNAAKRLLANMTLDYGKYQKDYNFLFVEDALYANAPHIRDLKSKSFDYLLNVKPESHKTLFAQIEGKRQRGDLKTYQVTQDKVTHTFEYANNVPLCNSAPDVRVNFIHYQQIDKKGKKTTFTWITNIHIAQNRLLPLMKAARARWHIENETFNTLKNVGYRFEHNYGHGQLHLSTTYAYLMLLAFYVDQIVQACCHTFKKIEENVTTKIKIWDTIKAIFKTGTYHSMNQIYYVLANLFEIKLE